jgi:hypothetical protein
MIEAWYFQIGRRVFGPIGPAELKAKAADGEITRETPVRKISVGAWVEAGHVKGLYAAALPGPGQPAALRPMLEPAAAAAGSMAVGISADPAAESAYPLVEAQAGAETPAEVQALPLFQGPSRPAGIAYEIACRNCGARHTFVLKEEASRAQCAECDGEIVLPSTKEAYQRKKARQRRRVYQYKVVGFVMGAVVLLMLGLIAWTLLITAPDPLKIAKKAVQEQMEISADRILTPRAMALPKGGTGYQLYLVPTRAPTEWNAPGITTEYMVLLKGQTVVDVREYTEQNRDALFKKYGLK